MLWANLLHLSFNMWVDRDVTRHKRTRYPKKIRFATMDLEGNYFCAKPYLRFDMGLWNCLLQRMVDAGMNMVVIDLGDGVKYDSHPEIAVRNAWTVSRLKQELTKIRRMGLEPIPKLNFSTAHDTWLGPYQRCVSTDTYYGVCRDLISEVIRIFDRPRFFHLGLDEETVYHHQHSNYMVIRQHDLWWHDFYFLVKQVEKGGVRPWVWRTSNRSSFRQDEFFKKMPKSVVQSNWYYGTVFNEKNEEVKIYIDLEKHGYNQIPTGSNWTSPENFRRMVTFCKRHISTAHLLGFLQTSWKPTLPACRKLHLQAIDAAGQVIQKLKDRRTV